MYVPSSELLVKSSPDGCVAITTDDCARVPDDKSSIKQRVILTHCNQVRMPCIRW